MTADGRRPMLANEVIWQWLRTLTPGAVAGVHAVDADATEIAVDETGAWHTTVECPPETAQLLDLYLPLMAPERVVIGQLGQSLDGRIATHVGQSEYVTGKEDRTHLHRLRALVDAVVVGAGTVVADDPRLTVRAVSGANPARIVLDPHCRVTADRTLFRDGAAETLILHACETCAAADAPGVDHQPMIAGERGFRPHDVIETLHQRGFRRILVEGGGITVSRFVEAGVVDRLYVAVAPMLIGSGVPAVTLPAIDHLDDALRPGCRRFFLGADTLFELDLRA